MKKLLCLFWGLITTHAVHSAEISHINYDGMNGIVIAGPIISGDARKFKEIARRITDGKAVVFLNSQGGAAYEAIDIGEYINKTNFVTVVVPSDECYSACAIIWSSSNNKVANLPYSIIGYHALYNGYTGEQIGYANAKLGAVLSRWGYSDRAIEFMTFASPKEFNYLTRNNAARYGINYNELDFSRSNSNHTHYEQTAYDVVAGFYNALSVADGDLAAAYVIPEKRGIGPFNQKNIFKFYSSLRIPLKVQSIKQISNNQFKVNYTFTATKTQCKGIATVNIVNRNGYYLIQSIKANC